MHDCDVQFSQSLNTVALAGLNGSGKSRLLSCLIAPWLNDIPESREPDLPARVRVSLTFTEAETAFFDRVSVEAGWTHQADHIESAQITVSRLPTVGIQRTTEPPSNAIDNAFSSIAMLKAQPSLDVLYMPAERRFGRQGAGGLPAGSIQLGSLQLEAELESSANLRSSAFRSAGQFDDNEFESHGVALGVAASLPRGRTARGAEAPERWQRFRDTVNRVLAPKSLLDVTADFPDRLRVGLPDGSEHYISALSSGERQALTIVSRVLRAQDEHTIAIIDEPDVHLHPHLSSVLLTALTDNLNSQLFIATHSPALLDNLQLGAIWECRHDRAPAAVISEEARIGLYRDAGFKASELTQADVLIATEGTSDETLLRILKPELARASFKASGGRRGVIEKVRTLKDFDVPILGLVDKDVLANSIPASVSTEVFEWPQADIEAVLMSDRTFLEALVQYGHAKHGLTVADLESGIRQLASELRENAKAEIAQRLARTTKNDEYPTPKGEDPCGRLRTYLRGRPAFTDEEIESYFTRADELIDASSEPLTYVRGKWIQGLFASRYTNFTDGAEVLISGAKSMSSLPVAMQDFAQSFDAALLRGAGIAVSKAGSAPEQQEQSTQPVES